MEQIELESKEISPKPRKTGLYSKVDIRRLDLRTRLGRHVKALRQEFFSDLGGEDNVSVQVRVLVEDAIIPQLLALRSFTSSLTKTGFMGMLPEHMTRYWIALVNSLRLNLVTIGLERRAKDVTPLSARLAALAARTKKEGDNGQG